MKKILLSLMLIGTFLVGKSQVVLNEVYTEPNLPGHQEFFELYNTSVGGSVNLDCYQLVSFFYSKSGNVVTKGFYVLDIPNKAVAGKSWFVGAATNPFSAQGTGNTGVIPDFSWENTAALTTSGSLTKYTLDPNNLTYTSLAITGGLDNLFPVFTGTDLNTGIFLFNNGAYINGFMVGTAQSTTTVPDIVKNMPSFNALVSCSGSSVNVNLNPAVITLAEAVGSNAGTDNGFARTNDGACGTWKKTSSGVNHTPGRTNGAAGALTGSLTVAYLINCPTTPGTDAILNVNVNGATGDANAGNTLPVEVQLYYDNGTIEQLDGADTYQGSVNIDVFAGPAKQFIIPYADKNKPLIIVFKTVLGCFDRVVSYQAACIPLPVKFKSFDAKRSTSSNVSITWITASEQNSKGFNVQKNVAGEWKTIAFVFSQAEGGNSSSDLSYSFKDVNQEKGITQYRIQQVDLDGMAKYSDIKAIRGETTASKVVVYPNPSVDGKLNVMFEDNSAVRDVQVADMQGRIVKSFKGITNNILVIEKLTSGFYTIKVTNRNTAAASVEKVVVK